MIKIIILLLFFSKTMERDLKRIFLIKTHPTLLITVFVLVRQIIRRLAAQELN